jgi:hypothetical protein
MQALACICTIIEVTTGECRGCAQWMRLCANIIFCITCGCMSAQVHNEMKVLERQGMRVNDGAGPPIMEMSMPDGSARKTSPSRESATHGGEPSSSTTKGTSSME